MDARHIGHGLAEIPGHDGRVVVRTHVSTSRVFVDERGVRDGVITVQLDSSVGGHGGRVAGRGSGIQRVLTLDGQVLGSPGHEVDSVRETQVVGVLLVQRAHNEVGLLQGLHLVDVHVAGSLAHQHTLIIVDNHVVSQGLNRGQGGGQSAGGVIGLIPLDDVGQHNFAGHFLRRGDQQILPAAQTEVNLHVIEGQGGHGQGNTRIFAEEEGQRQVEITASAEGLTLTNRRGHGGNLTNHGVVTGQLGGRDAEVVVEVQPSGVELLNREFVEGDCHLLHQIVHEVVGPTDGIRGTSVVTVGARGALQTDTGDLHAQPDVQHVITATIDRGGELLVKAGSARHVTQADGHEGEPVGLLHTANEIGDGHGTTIHIGGQIIESSEINESDGGGNTRLARHYNGKI